MRVKVTKQNILEYGLDTLTGNTSEDLLARAAEAEANGHELFVNIPDAEGGDTEAPEERNIFEHYNADLPDPEGASHEAKVFDLRTQAYIRNPCSYQLIMVGASKSNWYCKIHDMPSKHSVDKDSHAPCLRIDPYEEKGN